jgi:hypothetical protein
MNYRRIIRLADLFEAKYAQQSIHKDMLANLLSRSIKILSDVVSGQIRFGKDKAQEILNYLTEKQSALQKGAQFQTRIFVNASYIDNIIANMVYSGLPQANIEYNMQVLLATLADQELESTGSFSVKSIPDTILRYKKRLQQSGSPEVADEGSVSGKTSEQIASMQSKPTSYKA